MTADPAATPRPEPGLPPPRRFPWIAVAAPAALVVGALMGVGLMAVQPVPHLAPTLATLEETVEARWHGADIPTREGARLPAGRLALASGLATLRFDSGARLTLEGPTTVQLGSAESLRLDSGALVADVPEIDNKRTAGGDEEETRFTIETAHASFAGERHTVAILVDDSGTTRARVLDGEAQATAVGQREPMKLGKGESARFTSEGPEKDETPASEWSWRRDGETRQPAEEAGGPLVMHAIRTGTAQSTPTDSAPAETLLVKNALGSSLHRKAVVTFDLAPLAGREIAEASLTLNAVPSGLGLAALVPSAWFAVYAVTAEGANDWSPGALDWNQPPAAAAPQLPGKRPREAHLVGRFRVERGTRGGSVTVGGPELAELLARRRGDLVTFVLVRETPERHEGGYVHAFAGKDHAHAPGPVLRLRLAGGQ